MSTYLVVHHRADKQSWVNSWLDDDRLEAIQTTPQVAHLCRTALASGQQVFVHRCAAGHAPPVICCALEVDSVSTIGGTTWLVKFKNQHALSAAPPVQPMPGQNSYVF
jgi:hypothetical protein